MMLSAPKNLCSPFAIRAHNNLNVRVVGAHELENALCMLCMTGRARDNAVAVRADVNHQHRLSS